MSEMGGLDAGYVAEVDQVHKDQWHALLQNFDDATFYQTWSYGAAQWREGQLSHLVLKLNEKIVGLAQLRTVGMPALRLGTAYLNWGPLWKPRGEGVDPTNLKNLMRALRIEYAVRRGYLLRVLPRVPVSDQSTEVRRMIEEEKFVWRPDALETAIVDLTPPLEELRRSLRKSWSRSLSYAERQNLEFVDDAGDESCEIALRLANEMQARKEFYGCSQPTVVAAHKDLPDSLKLRILVCRDQGEPVAVLGWTMMGKTGIGLLGATGTKALKSKASFLLWWKMIEYYKTHGFSAVDLAAVNAERNPGGYFFKAGLAGRSFKEPTRFIGQFEACVNPLSALAASTAYAVSEGRKILLYRVAKMVKALKPAEAKGSNAVESTDTHAAD